MLIRRIPGTRPLGIGSFIDGISVKIPMAVVCCGKKSGPLRNRRHFRRETGCLDRIAGPLPIHVQDIRVGADKISEELIRRRPAFRQERQFAPVWIE